MTQMFMIYTDIIRDYQHNQRYQRAIKSTSILDSHKE